MVATMASAVLGVVLGAVTKNVAALVVKLVEKRCELSKGFRSDLEFIKRELLMIAGAEEDQLSGKGDTSSLKSISMEEMRDLAHDIEDCLDRILRYTELEVEGQMSLLHQIKALGGPPYAAEVKKLKERLKAAHQRKLDYNVNGCESSAAAGGQDASSSAPLSHTNTARVEPVGIDEAKRELLELLDDIEGEPELLNVISIVGFSGSGKSTLARAVYDCPHVASRFPCRAWIEASDHRGATATTGLLTALFEELRPGNRANGDAKLLEADIANYLNDKRYLIVFDDMEEQQWESVRSIFLDKTRSRIIVTTNVQTVGNVCSHGNGYVYNMRTLDMRYSKELLEAVLKEHLPAFEHTSTSIMNKCDGNPLALVSVANYLLRKKVLTERDCEQVCLCLGYHMEKEYSFRKLHQVLMNNYNSLPGYLLKTCLLYVSVFPNGHIIRRSSLIRRWLAEGYVQCQHPRSTVLVADQNFEELIDRNIIRPIHSSKTAKVKTCRAHGIMHEFMRHMSKSAKFITSHSDPERSNYRHLFMENPSGGMGSGVKHRRPACGNASSSSEKFRARSLTICGTAGEAIADFAKCELLRVLDLEECSDVVDDNINCIHKLWHLKYLSLGATIGNLPRKIEKLHCLETLDVRKTKIDTLPLEVVKLPHLAHLLGKFRIRIGRNDLKMSEPYKLFSKQSNLQTLAGFVADDSPGFPMLMVHMRKLKKVKIWYNATDEDSKILADLSTAIRKFVQDEIDTGVGVRSLSLYLGNSSGNILFSLENMYGYLSSLKLHGPLRGVTQFATSLCGLTELCLSSTNNLTTSELSNLRMLKHLEHLKLVKVSLGSFVIRRKDFPRLLRLCLVQTPNMPTIEGGALPKLVSLHLLCEDLVGLSGIEIEWHKHLQEVALDFRVNMETITIWENATRKHPKRPMILFLRTVDADMLKHVATERPPAGTGTESSTWRPKREIQEVQPSSVIDLDSALKRMKFSGPSLASTSSRAVS